MRRGMGHLRLDRDWIGLGEGHGTVALRLLSVSGGKGWGGTRGERASRRARARRAHKGRDVEASPPFCASASLVAELGRSGGISTKPSARRARTALEGGFSIWGSTPQPRLTRWGTVVTAAWEHGDLASCQSPSCDERPAQRPGPPCAT